MDHETIIQLMHKANIGDPEGSTVQTFIKFADVVADFIRPAIYGDAFTSGQIAGAVVEREACAKVCEALQDWPENSTPYDCAAAIRGRE